MKFSQFSKKVLSRINGLEEQIGDSFLELMVDTIEIFDRDGNPVRTTHGLEYNLSRSRHWDKQQHNYIFYDGFSHDHLLHFFNDLMELEPVPGHITLNIEGMNDLDEPIHNRIDLELDTTNE